MVVLPHPTGSRVFAFGAALTLWAAALAAQPSARVTGIVEDSSGTAVPGVRVALIGAAATQFALTDADGRFAFVEPPDGEYDVTASAPGFAPATARVRLAGAGSVAVVLKLWVLAFEKITVTAAKTGERDLQATPLAVSVLSGAELQRARARTVEEIAGLAPSLSFSQNTGFSQLDDPRHRDERGVHGGRSELGHVRRRRVLRAARDGAQRVRRSGARGGAARSSRHALRPQRRGRRAERDHATTHGGDRSRRQHRGGESGRVSRQRPSSADPSCRASSGAAQPSCEASSRGTCATSIIPTTRWGARTSSRRAPSCSTCSARARTCCSRGT